MASMGRERGIHGAYTGRVRGVQGRARGKHEACSGCARGMHVACTWRQHARSVNGACSGRAQEVHVACTGVHWCARGVHGPGTGHARGEHGALGCVIPPFLLKIFSVSVLLGAL